MRTFYDLAGIPKRYDSWGSFSIMSDEDKMIARVNNGDFTIDEKNRYTIDSIIDTLTNIKNTFGFSGTTRVIFNHQKSYSVYNAATATVYRDSKNDDNMIAINIGNYDRKVR